MKYGELIVEKKEYQLLRNIMSMAHFHKDPGYRASLEKLMQELSRARIVKNREMPDDVIRFNSTVSILIPTGEKRSYQLVIPEKADLKQYRISVLAPMGLALFGYAEGDEVLWKFPGGENIIKILEVTQLELV